MELCGHVGDRLGGTRILGSVIQIDASIYSYILERHFLCDALLERR